MGVSASAGVEYVKALVVSSGTAGIGVIIVGPALYLPNYQ